MNLKPKLERPNLSALINPIIGWEISGKDDEVMELGKSFSSKLKRKLKDTNMFDKSEFLSMLKQLTDLVESTEVLMDKGVCRLVWGGQVCV